VATAKPEQSRAFYQDTLDLKFISDQPYALVFDTGGIMMRVQKVEQVVPPPYTVLGWEVENIDQSVTELTARGVVFEQFPFLTQDESAIWTTPENAKVAWFKDPDGNMVSITQGNG
jgi:catechol 2,3-dioxygenase-like lactoylglutathione lyase family enzyme